MSVNPRPELGFGMVSLNSGSFPELADISFPRAPGLVHRL